MGLLIYSFHQRSPRLLSGLLLGAALIGAAVPALAQRIELLAGERTIAIGRVDSPKGSEAVFQYARAVTFAAQIPWEEKEELRNGWVVVDGPAVRWVSMTGSVRTLAEAGAFHGMSPHFFRVAVSPGGGPWACYLWDSHSQSIWRLDAHGKLAWFCGKPRKHDERGDPSVDGPPAAASFAAISSMTADSKGNLYVTDGDGRYAIRRIAPDGWVTTLPVSTILHDPGNLALDEDGKVLYALEGEKPRRIISISLDFGTVTSVLEGGAFAAFRGYHAYFEKLGWYQGRLIVLYHKSGPSELVAVDPKTGQSTLLFLDSGKRDLTPGPSGTGSLGRSVTGLAIGQAGQICLLAQNQLGLLLDWPQPGAVAPPGGPAVATDAAESKAPPQEEKKAD